MKKILTICLVLISVTAIRAQDAKMNDYVSKLMAKMTIDEKIGQLNLVIPGGAVTGTVVSKNVDTKIRQGNVGGLFGITGPDKVRQAQEIAVKDSRLHIPLIFGLDVIHGHRTIFPIPLGLSCSWDMDLIEKSARIAAREASADGLAWAFSPWWTSPGIRAGEGFPRDPVKIHIWVRKSRLPWCAAIRARI